MKLFTNIHIPYSIFKGRMLGAKIVHLMVTKVLDIICSESVLPIFSINKNVRAGITDLIVLTETSHKSNYFCFGFKEK